MLSTRGGGLWNGFVSECNVIAGDWVLTKFVRPQYTQNCGTLSRTSKAFDTTLME
jgi:hypothetical protein